MRIKLLFSKEWVQRINIWFDNKEHDAEFPNRLSSELYDLIMNYLWTCAINKDKLRIKPVHNTVYNLLLASCLLAKVLADFLGR